MSTAVDDQQVVEAYCLNCKTTRRMLEPEATWSVKGQPGTKGRCEVCGRAIYKSGHTPAHDDLPKPARRKSNSASGKSKVARNANGKGKDSKGAQVKKTEPMKSAAKKRGSNGSSTPATRRGKLVVVESPAKARTIGRYLGSGYTVKSSVGHVRDLLKSRLSVDIERDFEPEYRVPTDKRAVVAELRSAAERATEIYLATDPDREGEAIAWHVAEAADMDPARTRRVVFQEITKTAILEAFSHPRDIDMDRVNAQQARRILDRLVGYKLSPLLWRKVRRGLSAGRVQSVAVRLVVEREREIEGFEPQEYWSLEADLARQNERELRPRPHFRARLHRFEGKELPLQSEGAVKPHLAALERAAWQIGEVRLGERKRRPAAPFTTSTLQQEASRRLGFGANKTMRLAQELYEGVDLGGDEGSTGLITYMRTDSVTVSSEAQAAARDYILSSFGKAYVPDQPPAYRTQSKLAQEAHEAVRPTAVTRLPANVKRHLSRDQFRLYELIWQRFVASQMAPAVYDTVSADVHAGPDNVAPAKRPYLFRAAGSTLRFDGFLKLYTERDSDEEIEAAGNPVPSDLANGELLDLLKLLPEQHFTQPPPRFSEATLVKELEENGIGRPSTYAAILSTIVDRGYVETQEKRLAPTETGRLVNDLLVEYFPKILSVDFTALMEGELDEIADGRPWVPVIDEFYSGLAENLERADKALPKLELKVEPEFVGRECPLCGSPLVYRDGKFGRFIGCSNFPTCRHTEQILVKLGIPCPQCGGELLEKRTRRGKSFYGCVNYPECDWTNWKRPIQQPCRVCGGLLVQLKPDVAKCTNCGEEQPVARTGTRERSPI